MAALRRGFKSEAERISATTRAELGLTLVERLDCSILADHLGIPVISLPELERHGACAKNIRRLVSADSGFSAMTICVGSRRLIVYNAAHSRRRRANSLAHELSHVILEHPPMPAIAHGGCRKWDDSLETEADWLAGALLVPRDGALHWMRNGGGFDDGAEHYGVSTELFRWRVNQTGVSRQLAARLRKRRRP
jgi:Zn-dependent peptidase ImmA (M78 family)